MAPLTPIELRTPFLPASFSNTNAISEMHKRFPRAGRSNDPLPLFIGPKEKGKDYIVGVILIVVFIFLLFFIWSVAILACKCVCRKKAGFLSGTPPSKPWPPPPGYRVRDGYTRNEENHNDPCVRHEHEYTVEFPLQEFGVASITAPVENQENIPIPSEIYPGQPLSADINEDVSLQDRSGSIPATFVDDDGPIMYVHDNQSQNQNSEDINEYDRAIRRVKVVLLATRAVVMAAGAGVIAFSVLFVAQGTMGIGAALDNGILGLEKTQVIIEDGISLCRGFIDEQMMLAYYFSDIYGNFSGFGWCPKLHEKFVQECLNGTALSISWGSYSNYNYSASPDVICTAIIVPIKEALDTVELTAIQTRNAIVEDSKRLVSDLKELSEITDDWQSNLQSFRWTFWISVGFSIFLVLLVLFLLVGVVLALRQGLTTPFKCVRSRLVVPLFICTTFLVWLFASISCIVAVVGADFCFNGPDPNIIAILNANKYRFGSVVFDLGIYYLSGCSPSLSPKQALLDDEVVSIATQTVLAVHDLINRTQEIDEARFMDICGASISPVLASANYLDTQFHIVFEILVQTNQLLSCSNVHPVYETVVYDAICYDGVSGLFKMLVTLFFMVCCSMTIITFRAAWQEEAEVPVDLHFEAEINDQPFVEGPPSSTGAAQMPTRGETRKGGGIGTSLPPPVMESIMDRKVNPALPQPSQTSAIDKISTPSLPPTAINGDEKILEP